MGITAVSAGQRITASLLNGLPVSIPLATGSVASSAAETVIGTFPIPASDPAAAAGSGFRFAVSGSADDTATPTLTLRMRFNSVAGTQIFSSIAALTCRATVANMMWFFDGWIIFSTGGAAASTATQGELTENIVSTVPASHANAHGPDTVDTTVAWSLVVTAAWSAASASNICRTLAGGLNRM